MNTEERELKELCDSIRGVTEMVESWTRELRQERLARHRHAAGKMERLTSRGLLEVKRAGGLQAGHFRGYASKFGEAHETSSYQLPPGWNDVLAEGAFASTLSEHRNRNTRPVMLLQHDLSGLPIGKWTEVREDHRGLYVEGELAVGTSRGAEVNELLRMGAMDGLSIGFRVTKQSLDQKARLRTIQAVDLFEISPVTIPADPGARIQDVGA